MRIWHLTRGFAPISLVEGQPVVDAIPTGVVALEVKGPKGNYRVELSLDDFHRLAAAFAKAVGGLPR